LIFLSARFTVIYPYFLPDEYTVSLIMSNEMRYNVKSSQFLISQLHTESGPVLNFVWIKYLSIQYICDFAIGENICVRHTKNFKIFITRSLPLKYISGKEDELIVALTCTSLTSHSYGKMSNVYKPVYAVSILLLFLKTTTAIVI
jgi:hypothetical protein